MKKILLSGLIALFLLSLTACGSESDADGTEVNTGTEISEGATESMPVETSNVTPASTPSETQSATPEPTQETATIMESYDFGGMKAEVGYDEGYSIFVNFAPFDNDKRIAIMNSDESELEWLSYTGSKDENADKTNLDIHVVRDSVTGKDYYFLKLYFAGAPFAIFKLYLLEPEQGLLMDDTELRNIFNAVSEFNAVLTKRGGEYNISIPDYGINENLEFYLSYEQNLKQFRGGTGWDEFTMDNILRINPIEYFNFEDDKFTATRTVIADDNEWFLPMYLAVVYEIQNGVITPVEYKGIPYSY